MRKPLTFSLGLLVLLACGASTPREQLAFKVFDGKQRIKECHDKPSCDALVKLARDTWTNECSGGQNDSSCVSIRGSWREAISFRQTQYVKPAVLQSCGANDPFKTNCACDVAREQLAFFKENAEAKLEAGMLDEPRRLCPDAPEIPPCSVTAKCVDGTTWDANRCLCTK